LYKFGKQRTSTSTNEYGYLLFNNNQEAKIDLWILGLVAEKIVVLTLCIEKECKIGVAT